MRATLSDIARQVGVSKSLVSMYLNNHQLSSKIAAETKRKIDQAVKELDYKPSFAARALSNGKTRTIGMVCGGIKNPYFANLVEDAQEQAVRKGYQLLLGLTRWIPEEEKETALFEEAQEELEANEDIGADETEVAEEPAEENPEKIFPEHFLKLLRGIEDPYYPVECKERDDSDYKGKEEYHNE